MALTVSTHLAIPSLIGRGLTENAAHKALKRARLRGADTVQIAGKVIPISYALGKFTIGAAH